MKSIRMTVFLGVLALTGTLWAINPTTPLAPATTRVEQEPAAETILLLPRNTPVKVSGFSALTLGGLLTTGTPARQATDATLRWNNTGLEVVFNCADNGIVAAQQGRDNIKLWKDDCVYIWLDPGHAQTNQIMLQVSAGGQLHDSRNGDGQYDVAGLTADVTRTDTGWRANITVPWQGLGLPKPAPGDIWGINLTRADHPGTYNFNTMEISSWMPVPSGEPQDGKAWAYLIFADTTVKPDVLAVQRALEEQLQAAHAAVQAALKAKRLAIEPANPNASPDTYRVLKYLASLPDKPDKRVLVGQNFCSSWITPQAGYDKNVGALAKATGKWLPLVEMGWELGGGNTTDIAGSNQILIDHWNAGGLVSIMINPVNPFNNNIGRYWDDRPVVRGSLAEVIKPGTPANAIWMDYLERMAKGLAQLRDAGVVVLLRPLHEMTFKESSWYDIGASYPDPEPYKNLWKHMFNYLTYEKGLNNLIWVYSAAASPYTAPADACYPGDDYVDIVGLSVYSNEVTLYGQTYARLVALGKPFVFGEFGPETSDGSWDNMRLVEAIRTRYPATIYAEYWSSFAPRSQLSIIDNKNADKLLHDPLVLSRGELDWKNIPVPDSWVHPPKTEIKVDVVGNNSVLGRIPLKRGTVNLQGEAGGLQYARDLTVTREQDVTIFRGTVLQNNVAVNMVQRVSAQHGNLRIDLEASANGPAPELVYTLQVPTTRFAGGTYTADEKTGPLPAAPLPMEAIKCYQHTARKVLFTAPGGLKLGVELNTAADITIQDSRRWSPNFSVPIIVHPDGAAKDGKTTLTIILSLE